MQRRLLFLLILIGILFVFKNQLSSPENIDSDQVEIKRLMTDENLELEMDYSELLKPIVDLKTSDPKIYWFIVSWLGTNYNTPLWKDYGTEQWKQKTKNRGIDCSGFARVMQQEIFSRKIRGSSSGILNTYCIKKDKDGLEIGDLVFFKANSSKSNRIVHVGVYIKDRYFVHATSRKSAANGLGLNINSLQEKRWKAEFVTGGSIKQK